MKNEAQRIGMNEDVTCPRCGRLTFAWEKNITCAACAWVLRPKMVEKPFGCDVLVEIQDGSGTKKIEKHYMGNQSQARRRARVLPKFRAVLAVVPLTEAQWKGAYGFGAM